MDTSAPPATADGSIAALTGEGSGSCCLRGPCRWSPDNRLTEHAPDYRDRGQDADCQERPSCRFPLILVEPIRNQQANASAERNPCSSDQHHLRNCESSLCQSHMALESHEYQGGLEKSAHQRPRSRLLFVKHEKEHGHTEGTKRIDE